MSSINIIENLEILRQKMVKYYMADDMENAIKISNELDKVIYNYLVKQKKLCKR